MQYSNEAIQALANLRTYARRYPTMGLSEAVNALDNAGVFAALDEQTDYASAESILAESAKADIDKALGALDVAEWGDTTRWDQFVRQNCTCGLLDQTSPALHAGTCPVWAGYHNLPGRVERIPGTDILRPAHEHQFRSPHSDEVCYTVEWCMLTYGEHAEQALAARQTSQHGEDLTDAYSPQEPAE